MQLWKKSFCFCVRAVVPPDEAITLVQVQEIVLCERKEGRNCWMKGNRNIFRLWFKISGPHSSLLAACAGLFYLHKERAKYICPLTHNLFWCCSRRYRWARVRVTRETHKHFQVCLCLVSPLYQTSSKGPDYHPTTESGASAFEQDLWWSFAPCPAGAGRLDRAGTPTPWTPFAARPACFPSVLDLQKSAK